MIIRCGEVVLDFARYEAVRAGEPIHLRPKIFNLLAYLVERRDRVVLKQEIHDCLWSEQIVGDSALDTSVKEARRVFGDTGSEQSVIKTVRGRGFRFVGEIEIVDRPLEPMERREHTSAPALTAPSNERQVVAAGSTPATTLPRSLSRFVGRAADLQALVAKLESAQKGQGRVVGIVGEPGQGKTRLLAELRQRTSRRRYVSGRCRAPASGCSSLLVADMLREHCGIGVGDDLESVERRLWVALAGSASAESRSDWRAFLLHLLGLGTAPELQLLGPRALQLRTFEALYRVLVQPGDSEPVVVEIDDLHWIDSYSASWLEWLQRGIMGSPLLLLAAYRPGYAPSWIGRSYATQIALEPLTEADSRSLVEDILPRERRSDSALRTIVERAKGNPFFLEELARNYGEDGLSSPVMSVPDSIRTFLAARLARLPSGARAILDALAVVNAETPYSLLRSVTALSDSVLHEQLALLMDAELLVESPRPTDAVYSFQHALARDAAYQSLLDADRRRLHAQVARALTCDQRDVAERCPDRVAHHFAEAEMGEEFAHYWLRANEQALRLRFVDQAIDYLRQGLGILVALPESEARDQQELGLRVNLAGALNMAGNHDAATVADILGRAEEMLDRLADTPQLFWALSGLARHYFFRGDVHSTRRTVERLRRCGEHVGVPAIAHILKVLYPTYMALVRFCLGDVEEAQGHAERGLALHDPALYASSTSLYLHDPGVLCRAYGGASALLAGRPKQARKVCAEAVTTARTLARPWNLAAACTMSANVLGLSGEHELASRDGELAEAVCQEHGLGTYGTAARGILGRCRCARGDLGGLHDIRGCLEVMRRTGWNLKRTGMLVKYAEALSMTGRIEEGLAALAEAESLFEAKGERYMEAEVYRLRGDLLLEKGPEHSELAEALYRQALRTANARKMRWWELRAATSLGQLWRRSGKAAEAREIIRPIYESFDEGHDTADLAAARALLA
jgi:DNA-binding winged helix-turn-helix (wHTH) protein/tetratricopeptide (TPR) repeat protein